MVVALSEARSENHERIQRSWMSRVEPEEGLEPTTYCLQNSYSAAELLRLARTTGSRTSKPNCTKFGKKVLGQNS